MSIKQELFFDKVQRYINAFYPLISLSTFEEAHTDELIEKWAQGSSCTKILEWSNGLGWVDFKTKRPLTAPESQQTLAGALSYILAQDQLQGFLILRDAWIAFQHEPQAALLLKALVRKIQVSEDASLTIFLVGSKHEIPLVLEKDAVRFDIPLPDRKAIENLLHEHASIQEYLLKEDEIPDIVTALQGLGEQELQQLLNRACYINGNISRDDVELFISEKEQIVRRNAALEMIEVKEKPSDIGGLKNLKDWLQRKGRVFSRLAEAKEFGVDTPKGVLIVGMPGCGKSLCAKATANIFNIPLLRLDLGSVFGKYVGESEANLRRALSLSEAIAPCVLWLDELEKAFAGVGSSNGEVTTRLFGYFLTWLQENTKPIFVVATANNIDLPPELLRKGRFDETFFVTFPTEKERKEIIEIHLHNRKDDKNNKDKYKKEVHISSEEINILAKKMESFAGSDIESVVKDAIESAFLKDKAILTIHYLEEAMKNIKPLKTMAPDLIKKYDEIYKKYSIRPAS